jgi:hypothetical protein
MPEVCLQAGQIREVDDDEDLERVWRGLLVAGAVG